MEFTSDAAEQRYADFRVALSESVIGLDFDGTLSPIVDDPDQAHIHPDAQPVLEELATRARLLAVITGRPASQAISLGGLDDIGAAIGAGGHELHVYGQYGYEHWSSAEQRIDSPRPPEGLSSLLDSLPETLGRADAADAFVERKGLAVAVHTRQLPDAAAAYDRLLPVLREEAERRGLAIEPGRQVIEVRAPDMDKGKVVRRLVEETGATGFCFAGDDLGDVEAFEAVAALSEDGLATLLVCARRDAAPALAGLADVVVDGPDGVLALFRDLLG